MVEIAWIELCGITLSGSGGPDAGLVWEDLTGWWGLPNIRGQQSNIPGGHGSFARSALYRDSRVITLKGHIVAYDRAAFNEVRDGLVAALSQSIGLMRVATDEGIWERNVEIDTLSIDPDHGRTATSFTVDMVSPDPRRYGPVQSVGPVGLPVHLGGVRLPKRMPWNFGSTSGGSRLVISNGGSIPLSPVITVTGGGFSQLSVVDITAARQLILQLPGVTSADVVLDSATHRVYVGGQEVTRLLSTRQWFEVPAGETHRFRFEAPGAVGPLMTGSFRIGAW
ncbi:hypothetical protein ACIPY5_12075 [Microbacterium sp. NPDC089698]|uniref:hypothetical protein n=1 Tax=Microbacterium sp. NPDC089698 TaxID=3364200 RepID=UPI003811164B